MPLVGFEPTISAGERPQTYTLDRAATGTSYYIYIYIYIYIYVLNKQLRNPFVQSCNSQNLVGKSEKHTTVTYQRRSSLSSNFRHVTSPISILRCISNVYQLYRNEYKQ